MNYPRITSFSDNSRPPELTQDKKAALSNGPCHMMRWFLHHIQLVKTQHCKNLKFWQRPLAWQCNNWNKCQAISTRQWLCSPSQNIYGTVDGWPWALWLKYDARWNTIYIIYTRGMILSQAFLEKTNFNNHSVVDAPVIQFGLIHSQSQPLESNVLPFIS